MSIDRSLERFNTEWSLTVSDFAATDLHGAFVSTRLHVRPSTRMNVRQFAETKDHHAFVDLEFGPHAQVFISHAQARDLLVLLSAFLSVGASVDTPPPHVVSATTVAAPAEPSKEQS